MISLDWIPLAVLTLSPPLILAGLWWERTHPARDLMTGQRRHEPRF